MSWFNDDKHLLLTTNQESKISLRKILKKSDNNQNKEN